MRTSYDGNILTTSNIYAKDINSSRNFFGNSSKLENLQNLYFYLNPITKSNAITTSQQLKELKRFQHESEGDELDKKYGKPIINNYKRFHHRAEEIKKAQGKNLDKNKLFTNYTPKVKNNPNLAFYSIADLSMLHPLTYQKVKATERNLTSGNLKYNTRLQMVDEKLKKLEEKNECLNIINNIFFDSLKDNLTQSLKRKAFLRKHLKDIEYLKQINLEEYNNKVNDLMNLVEQGQIDFDNYNFEGEPLNGVENMAGHLEALKTEIGTMLTKNTMKHDINLNLLKQDVEDIKDELEKKLVEFSENNNKNYEILKEYLFREEQDRLKEKKKNKKDIYNKRAQYIPETRTNFEIKGKKQGLKLYNEEEEEEKESKESKESKEEEEKEEKESTENPEQSEVSTETNKNLDVIDKILLDSISLSLTSNGQNIKSSKSSKNKTQTQSNKKSSKSNTNENNNENNNTTPKDKTEENEIVLTSSSGITSKKSKKSKSKKSKWKLLQQSEESNNEKNNNINNNIQEIKEEDESNIDKNNKITGTYKSKFDSNKPEIQSKSKRSKASKKFKLSQKSKESNENKEENIQSKTSSKKEESTYKIKNEESAEDDVIVGTESSSDTTESFKITLRSNKINLNSIKENQEVFLSNDNSKNKSDNDKKSRKSRKSKKSKKRSNISQSIKEKSKEEEDDDN